MDKKLQFWKLCIAGLNFLNPESKYDDEGKMKSFK